MGKSGAGNHVANFGKSAVAAKTEARARESHPDSSAVLLHGAGQRTIVNHLTANRGNPANRREDIPPQQDTSARGSGGACARVADPARRIKHQEKIEKWRNQQAFRKSLCLKQHHQGNEIERISFRAKDQAVQGVRRVLDIRIGEPEKIRLVLGSDLHAFVQRPEFSRPTRRQRSRGVNFHALRSAGFTGGFLREGGGPVLAVVIHDDDREFAGILLPSERMDGFCDVFRFIASGNDGGDARPICKRLQIDVVFAQLPKVAAREKKINPDRQRNRSDKSRRKRHALFCNNPGTKRYARSSLRIGSRRMGLPVAAKMALQTAGAIGGVPGSPTPPGGSLLCTM